MKDDKSEKNWVNQRKRLNCTFECEEHCPISIMNERENLISLTNGKNLLFMWFFTQIPTFISVWAMGIIEFSPLFSLSLDYEIIIRFSQHLSSKERDHERSNEERMAKKAWSKAIREKKYERS